MARYLVDRLHAMLEPGTAALGFELVAVELAGSGRNPTVRVYIDSAAGISVEDCADVSRQLSAILDVEDPIGDSYTLEVSSPGFDRPLRKPEHFQKVIGERVKITLHRMSGRRRFTGVLQAVHPDRVEVEVDGDIHELAFADIEKARLVPVY
ncbi:MAG: ribosome maturation factor RimP [Gammaproteobacteria bacterium]|nr:ribosome maturation factor RimP [Gammaproteobacteria bacterium]